EDVASFDLGEQLLVVDRRREARMHDRVPGLLLELGAVEVHQLLQLREIEQARDEVDLVVRRAQPALEPFEHAARHGTGNLNAHDVAAAPSPELALHGLEAGGGLAGDLEVGVAGASEGTALAALHAGEEGRQEVSDHALEGDEQAALADRQEARQQLWHLDAREALVAGVGVADEDAEAERERRD